MHTRRLLLTAVAGLAAGLLRAAEPAPEIALQIEGNDQMRYNVATLEAPAGKRVKLVLKNVGKLPKEAMGHNWVLLKPGTDLMGFGAAAMTTREHAFIPQEASWKDRVIAHTALAGPGESVEVIFTAPAAGEYPFVCSFPGHVALMKGVLVVK